jgi:hypothetical protein
MPNGAKTDAVRERAVAALLACSSTKAAAAKSNVAHRTLRRWLAEDAEFQEMLALARRQALQLAIGRLSKATQAAVTALVRACRNGDAKAAATILDRAIRGIELVDVLPRLERLERRREGKR